MNVLIVHAHHEPKSFSSSLADQAAVSLRAAGHDVVTSDLYSMGFDPVSDRRNFTSVNDADYLKQQAEETHATQTGGFSADIESEIQKLEQADAVIFSFPLWWFGMPAILKGWADRVLAAGRVYGGDQLYENGIGKSKKRGMVLMTTGGSPDMYGGWGLNPSLETILTPILHGIFWFNGIQPLEPFVAWSPARKTNEDRKEDLKSLDLKMQGLFEETPLQLPPLADFPNWGIDTHERFMVVAHLKQAINDDFRQHVPAEQAMIAKWKKDGRLLQFEMSDAKASKTQVFLILRAADRERVEDWLSELPLFDYLEFNITQIAKPNNAS